MKLFAMDKGGKVIMEIEGVEASFDSIEKIKEGEDVEVKIDDEGKMWTKLENFKSL